jgi:hypothetical protein
LRPVLDRPADILGHIVRRDDELVQREFRIETRRIAKS